MSGRGKGMKRKRPQRRETRVVPNDVVPQTTTSSVACQAGDSGFAAAAVVSDQGVADADKSQLPTPINMGSHMLDEGNVVVEESVFNDIALHVNNATRQKIISGQYVDLSLLLHSNSTSKKNNYLLMKMVKLLQNTVLLL